MKEDLYLISPDLKKKAKIWADVKKHCFQTLNYSQNYLDI